MPRLFAIGMPKREHKKVQIIILVTAIITIVTACTSPFLPPTPTSYIQPESPLIPGKNLTLVENRWRLVEIRYHGKSVELDTIEPIYFTFDTQGVLGKQTTNCNSGTDYIIAESDHRYRLVPGTATAMGCGEIRERQYDNMNEAVRATTEYILQGTQLILTGDDVRIILEIDNPQ